MEPTSPAIVVTGSIATDHLMTYPGRFADSLLPERLAAISLSFLVEDLVVRRGGTAANIAYGLARLGLRPLLVGAAGEDFAPHREALDRQGVDCSGVLISADAHTARFICTTDTQLCQIASFYPGAMSESGRIDLATVLAGREPDLVLIAPDTPEAMVRHAAACRALGLPYAADPSQQLARMSATEVRDFITGARYLFTNEYEHALLCQRLDVSPAGLGAFAEVIVTTRGADGVTVRTATEELHVPAMKVAGLVDPTGGGDAFRAGFCALITQGATWYEAAAGGCLLASHALRAPGGQEYVVTAGTFGEGLAEHYGIRLAETVAGG